MQSSEMVRGDGGNSINSGFDLWWSRREAHASCVIDPTLWGKAIVCDRREGAPVGM